MKSKTLKMWLTQEKRENIDEILGIIKNFDTKNNTYLLNDDFIRAFVIFLYHNSENDIRTKIYK